jgi:hypothetical protein
LTADGAPVSCPFRHDMPRFSEFQPEFAPFQRKIKKNKVDVWIIDPFVRSHMVAENDNGKISAVCQEYSDIADTTNSAGELYHHVRKGHSGQGEYTIEDGRGAVALRDAVRSARVGNVMSDKEAEDSGIERRRRRSYFRIDNGKTNLSAPSDKTDWRYITGVRLGNATDDDPEDDVGVVTAWAWPNPLDGAETPRCGAVLPDRSRRVHACTRCAASGRAAAREPRAARP